MVGAQLTLTLYSRLLPKFTLQRTCEHRHRQLHPIIPRFNSLLSSSFHLFPNLPQSNAVSFTIYTASWRGASPVATPPSFLCALLQPNTTHHAFTRFLSHLSPRLSHNSSSLLCLLLNLLIYHSFADSCLFYSSLSKQSLNLKPLRWPPE